MEALVLREQVEKTKKKKIDEAVSKPKNQEHYRDELKAHLSDKIFEADPYRICWLVNYFSLSGIFYLSLVAFKLTFMAKLGLSVGIGVFNALLAFSTHELLHGGVIKSAKLQRVLGVFGFTPFFISPTFWNRWHNDLHHQYTQQGRLDPMSWPVHEEYNQSRFYKAIFKFTPGSGTKRSYMFLLFWYSAYFTFAQNYLRFKTKHFNLKEHLLISFENIFQIGFFITLFSVTDSSLWIWCFVIPFMVQNYLVSSYEVLSNSLMPITETNDVLENTLNIRNYPLNFIHHNSGYNIEHRIFPEIPFSKLPKVSYVAKEIFRDNYKSAHKWKALKALYKTPRVYKNNKEFIHPETMKVISIKILK